MTDTIEHAIKQLFDQTTATVGYDCSIIVGEERIGCHRAILQARSAVFKDIIISQSSNADEAPTVEMIFPKEDAEAINALVQYCYTNTISTRHISTQALAGNLLLQATKFRLPELGTLCKNVLTALEQQNLPASMEGKVLAVPNSPNLDLTCLIDDKTASDLVLKTESKDIFAHKCILLSRVPSLSSAMQTTSAGNNQVIDILSSRSHESVSRVMIFLYGDEVATATQEEVLEDLITAKKLDVHDLISKLERIVNISDVNALQILEFAIHNGLDWLRNATLSTLANSDYDGLFDKIKGLEECCSSISSEFEAVVRATEQARTKQAPQLFQGISFRGCLGLVVTSLSSFLLLRIQIENEFIVALTNVCFCFAIAFFFL